MTATSARQTILDRVRTATHADSDAYPDLPRNYVRLGALDLPGRLALMTERLEEYGADVLECLPANLPATIARQLESSGRHTFVAPAGLPSEWLDAGVSWKLDKDLSYAAIEGCEGVVTASTAGIAESGTIVLHHSGTEGRRVISLLPDFHLCILRASQIVETLPEYFARCAAPPPLATYISGPSATAGH